MEVFREASFSVPTLIKGEKLEVIKFNKEQIYNYTLHLLNQPHINYKSTNYGHHIQVFKEDKLIMDIWPNTGKFQYRGKINAPIMLTTEEGYRNMDRALKFINMELAECSSTR